MALHASPGGQTAPPVPQPLEHIPFTQAAPEGHAWPQAPQLAGSFRVSKWTQPPQQLPPPPSACWQRDPAGALPQLAATASHVPK